MARQALSTPPVVICNFRFEPRPETETVELFAGHHSTRICKECLVLLTVHRRIHHMKIENVIVEMAENRTLVTQV